MYAAPRPSVADIAHTSKKEYIHFNKADVDAMADLDGADILLLHEWPEDIIAPSDRDDFESTRRAMRYGIFEVTKGGEYVEVPLGAAATAGPFRREHGRRPRR